MTHIKYAYHRGRTVESRQFTAENSSSLFVMILRAAPVTLKLLVIPLLSTRSNDEERIHFHQNIGRSQNETWLPPLLYPLPLLNHVESEVSIAYEETIHVDLL